VHVVSKNNVINYVEGAGRKYMQVARRQQNSKWEAAKVKPSLACQGLPSLPDSAQ